MTLHARKALRLTAAGGTSFTLSCVLFVLGGQSLLALVAFLMTNALAVIALANWERAWRHSDRFPDENDASGDDWRGRDDEPPRRPQDSGIDWERFSAGFWAHVESIEHTTVC